MHTQVPVWRESVANFVGVLELERSGHLDPRASRVQRRFALEIRIGEIEPV